MTRPDPPPGARPMTLPGAHSAALGGERTPPTRADLIAIAERTIAGCCAAADDQFMPGHESVFSDRAAVLFTVHAPSGRRARCLRDLIDMALSEQHLTPWTRVWPTADGCRVEIRVPVGAP